MAFKGAILEVIFINNKFQGSETKEMKCMNKLEYIKDVSTGVEIVSFENVDITYPEHTHIGHYIFGIVTGGTVKIK